MKKKYTLYYINIFFTITQHIYKIMFFSMTGRLLPGADDVELLDVFVPEHGGGQPGLQLGVVLRSSDEEVLCPHSQNTG